MTGQSLELQLPFELLRTLRTAQKQCSELPLHPPCVVVERELRLHIHYT